MTQAAHWQAALQRGTHALIEYSLSLENLLSTNGEILTAGDVFFGHEFGTSVILRTRKLEPESAGCPGSSRADRGSVRT